MSNELTTTKKIRIYQADHDEIKRLASGSGLDETEIIRRMIHAGVKPVAKDLQPLIANAPRN